MNSYVERTRPALSFVDIGIALRDNPDASYCPLNPGNSNLVARLLTGLIGAGHDVFIQSLTDSEEEWRRNIASAIPSVGVVVGFADARNSPYLRQEWRVALSNGVPLILMIAEETPWLSTASELDSAPRFDMREWHSSEAEYSRLWSQISTFFGEGTRVSQEASEVGHVIRVGKVPVVDIKKLGMMMRWQPKADNVWEIDDGPALVNHVRPEDALVQDEVSAVCRCDWNVGRASCRQGGLPQSMPAALWQASSVRDLYELEQQPTEPSTQAFARRPTS
jgi:hypothetical protein